MNLLKIFSDAFQDNWDSPAVTDSMNGKTLTYGELASYIQKMHMLLRDLGVKEGTRIAIVGHNTINWIIAYIGTLTYGATAVTLPPCYDEQEMLSLLSDADTEILFAESNLTPSSFNYKIAPSLVLAISLDRRHVIYDRGTWPASPQIILDKLPDKFAEMFPFGFKPNDAIAPVLRPDAVCAIFFTSGTTDRAKPVMLMADNIEGNLIFGIKSSLFPRYSNAVTTTKFGTVWGTIFNLLVPLVSGAHVTVLTDLNDLETMFSVLQKTSPHRIMLSSMAVEKIYRHIIEGYGRRKISRWLRYIPGGHMLENMYIRKSFERHLGGKFIELLIGSVPIGPMLLGRLTRAGIRFSIVYGLTECGGLVSYTPCKNYICGTSGKTIPSLLKCRIRPLDYEGLPEDIGILEVRGMTLMKGYANSRSRAEATLTSDGWFPTDDLAQLSKTGDLTILGRLKTLVKTDHGYVIPERLQLLLREHREICHCLVKGFDGKLGVIIYPDKEYISSKYKSNTLTTENIIYSVVAEVNRMTSLRERIDIIEISPVPLAVTPKGTVARQQYV